MELQKRIITALVLVPVLFYCIFYLPNFGFRLAMGVVLVLGLWEWTRLIGISKIPAQALYILSGVAACFLIQYVPSTLVYGIAAAWWLLALALVIQFPVSKKYWEENLPVKMGMGFLLLLPTWLGLVELQGESPWNLMFVFVLIWLADSGAYFAGRQFGKRKLAPKVSPGKSIEGVAGGLLLSLIVALAVRDRVGLDYLSILASTVLFTSVILFSVLGDLTESMFKRVSGVKDSSQLLPGHGGILDRIDSLTAAVPIYYATLALVSL